MLILVWIVKNHNPVSDSGLHLGESNLPQRHLESKSPFFSLQPARIQAVNSAAIHPSQHHVTPHHFNTAGRESEAATWSDLHSIRGPEPPARLNRVICYHSVLWAAWSAQLGPIAGKTETSPDLQTFTCVSRFTRALKAQNLRTQRWFQAAVGQGMLPQKPPVSFTCMEIHV